MRETRVWILAWNPFVPSDDFFIPVAEFKCVAYASNAVGLRSKRIRREEMK